MEQQQLSGLRKDAERLRKERDNRGEGGREVVGRGIEREGEMAG